MSYKTFYGEEFFPQESIQQVLGYRYSGSDSSIVYKFFFSPVSQWLVDRVFPEWLASVYKPKHSSLTRLP